MKSVSKRVRMPKKVKVKPVPNETFPESAAEPGAPEIPVQTSKVEASITPPPPSTPHDIQQNTREDENHGEESTEEGPRMFEDLCERMLSALCIVQTGLSEVLDVKDELVSQNVPSAIQTQLSLTTSRLFRSMLDLYVPSSELVRLVRLYGPEWERRRQILSQLQGEHERLQRLLSLALRRMQHLEARLKHFRNWESFSARLESSGLPETSQILHWLELKRNEEQTAKGETDEHGSITGVSEKDFHKTDTQKMKIPKVVGLPELQEPETTELVSLQIPKDIAAIRQ